MAKANGENSALDATLEKVTGNAIAKTSDTQDVSILDTELMQSLSPEMQLEVRRDIMAAEAELETITQRSVPSRELIGVSFDVIDALFTTIPDDKNNGELKQVVNLVLRLEDGEVVTCMKPSNRFNDAYVNLFNKVRGIGHKELKNYTFAEDEKYSKAGNNAVVLRKLKPSSAAA